MLFPAGDFRSTSFQQIFRGKFFSFSRDLNKCCEALMQFWTLMAAKYLIKTLISSLYFVCMVTSSIAISNNNF